MRRVGDGPRVLVTGGCGFLGEAVIAAFRARGSEVTSFDKVSPDYTLDGVEYLRGDIRDETAVRAALDGIGIVVHAVAAVPLAKSSQEFLEVNVGGTRTALAAAEAGGATKFVYISSSAVYGIPKHNPVGEDDLRMPLEAYGRAKNDAEDICREFGRSHAIDVSVVRPRTILGPGRLGIFGVLFDWIAGGASVPVLGRGDNVYQFVHVTDLAECIVEVAFAEGSDEFNIGGNDPDTMREALDALCAHADTGARTFSLPKRMFAATAKTTSALRLSPLAPYHWLLYGESLYFDNHKVREKLGWSPRHTSTEALLVSYDDFLAQRDRATDVQRSPHRSTPKQGVLRMFRGMSRRLFSQNSRPAR